MRAIDRLTDKLDLLACLDGRVADEVLQLSDFALDDRQRIGKVHGRRRKMTRDGVELLGYLPALDRNLFALFADDRKSINQRFEFCFQSVDGLDGATDKDGHEDHRHRDREERCGHNHHHPEGRIVRTHL